MSGRLHTGLHRVTGLPEVNVIMFTFLLNYPWEFLQVPLFEGMAAATHWEAVMVCTRAALGDAIVGLVAFWGAAAMCSRAWIRSPSRWQVLGFVGIGLALTIILERLAVALGRWAYADIMPVVPILQVGLAPLLQWLLLPPIVVWMARRQLAGSCVLDRTD